MCSCACVWDKTTCGFTTNLHHNPNIQHTHTLTHTELSFKKRHPRSLYTLPLFKSLKPSAHQSLSWVCLFMGFNEQHGPKVEARKQTETWVKRSVCVCVGVFRREYHSLRGNERKKLLIFTLHPCSVRYNSHSVLGAASQIALKRRAALLVAFQPAFTKPW